MKKILIGLMVMSSVSAFGFPSEKIFKALNVRSVNVAPKSWEFTALNQKSVGGLVCIDKEIDNGDHKASCRIDADRLSLPNIYKALKVKEVSISYTLFEKRIDNFAIQKNTTGTDTYSLKIE